MSSTSAVLRRMWHDLGGDSSLLDRVSVTGPAQVLPSAFDVTAFATAAVGAANLAVAELAERLRNEPARAVTVDTRQASAAFVSEALFTPIGWERPPVWDPVAGDYRSADGWIRLHTNYRYHRDAVAHVLGSADDRESVAAAVKRWPGIELESAVVQAGGCAAVMHDSAEWAASPHGRVSAREPLVRLETLTAAGHMGWKPRKECVTLPLAGIRVLDLTRVIAGPVATRFLAAYGADVLRIDPPGFAEVPALLPETTAGKRCGALDLRDAAAAASMDGLLGEAGVLVCGLRADALASLGYDAERLRALNPGLVVASLDAYGWDGPWLARRGFDSLVQMSCGIAAAGAQAAGQDRPHPLPAQALDHATGYLLAAAIARASTRLAGEGLASTVRCSLIGTANLVKTLAVEGGLALPAPQWTQADSELCDTYWGAARRVPIPGRIEGASPALREPAGPLGRHAPAWDQG